MHNLIKTKYASMLRIATLRIATLAAFVSAAMIAPTHAQAQSMKSQAALRSRAAANVYSATADQNATGTSILSAYSAANGTPTTLMESSPDGLLGVSPDGKLIAVTTGSDTQDDQLQYGPMGGQLAQIQIDKSHRILSAEFSSDGKYLSYTTAAQESDDWVLGIIDLASGKKGEYAGKYAGENNGGAGFTGAGDVVGFSPDGKKVYLRTYMPYSASGGFDTIVALDLGGLNFDVGSRQPMPKATPMLKEGEQAVNFVFSPDGSKLALLLTDPANVPDGYTGSDAPPNILSVRDVASGSEVFNYKSDKGQGLEYALDWTPDGTKLVFASGPFSTEGMVERPILYALDVASLKVANIATINNAAASLDSALACSDAVFFVTSQTSQTGDVSAILYSVSLTTPTDPVQLATSSYISLATCIP